MYNLNVLYPKQQIQYHESKTLKYSHKWGLGKAVTQQQSDG